MLNSCKATRGYMMIHMALQSLTKVLKILNLLNTASTKVAHKASSH